MFLKKYTFELYCEFPTDPPANACFGSSLVSLHMHEINERV